jgi:regulator of protease activity HflC (stomatin/prohibitin superfamily)
VFGEGDGKDAGSITFVTKDGIEMSVSGVANFQLNTDCATLQKFHELIGNRYVAYTPEGWVDLLQVYIAQPLDTAIDRAGQAFTYQELYFDPAKKAEWEKAVVAALPDLVNRQTDGDEAFFGNYAITLQKPDPPAEVKAALTRQQSAVAEANAAKAQADAQVAAAEAQVAVERAEAQQIAEKIAVLGIDGYLREKAVEKGINPWQPTGATPLVNGGTP